ncbi:VWA domain-containing protein [Azotobacter salinestris]|uniref:VWA domain-containing protein n=1 Tax=Azotobacter salinestris TaxID=69964 RepID=UPI0032E003D7
MNILWPHWLRPEWLLLLPLLAWLLWRLWHRERRAGRWELLLPPAFHAALLGARAGRGNRLPWIALGLAWLLALVALLGPSWQRIEQLPLKRADPLVVLLELTPSMLAGDLAPNRLALARHKLLDLLEARQEAQTAVVVYAGSAHTLVPLSDDLETTRNLLDALAPPIMPVAGRRADLAVARGLALLEQGARGRGQLLLIGSELDERERQGIARALGGDGERLAILGIGSPGGAPIAQEDGSFLKDEQGAILLARLDSAGLARFAESLGGRYQSVSLDDRDLRRLGLLQGPQLLREGDETARLDAWADQGHWLLLPLLLLAACAGRRGWLLALPLLLGLPQPGQAFEFTDLWLRPDQQGRALLQAGRPDDAARRFEDSQWQGLALYQAGDYAAAAERFALGRGAAAHYNRGNALARAGELEAALDAYERALELQPALEPALHNKALVEELLRQRQQQGQQPEAEGTGEQQQAQSGQDGPSGQSGGQNDSQADAAAPQASEDAGPDDATAQPGARGSAQGEAQATGDAAPEADPIATAAPEPFADEHRQALEQWLRQIPDNPGELLRRKFWYEQQQHREASP